MPRQRAERGARGQRERGASSAEPPQEAVGPSLAQTELPTKVSEKQNRAGQTEEQADIMTKNRIYTTSFASVYPHYVAKAEKKGRTKGEVDAVISWLTGYSQAELDAQLEKRTDFKTLFAEAPAMNTARALIKGWSAAFAWRTSRSPRCGRSAIWISWSMSWPRAKPWKRSCGST